MDDRIHPGYRPQRCPIVEMRGLSLLALVPSVVHSAAVQANANAISPQIEQLVNATGLGSVDPRFTIDPEDGENAINDVSAYMNVLGILTSLARRKFDGVLPFPEDASIEPWTDVHVAVGAAASETLEVRFAIWGLYLSIQYMYKNGFADSIIELEYDGQPVGAVIFQLTRPNSLEAAGFNNNNITITDPEAAASDNNNSSITGLVGVPHTQVSYILGGKDLSTAAVYISLAGALVTMAEKDSPNAMFDLSIQYPEYNLRFKLTPEPTVVRPAPLPPYMTVGEGIQAVWFTALYMAQRHPPRYAEYQSLIIENDVQLGKINADYVAGPSAPPAVQKPGSAAAGNGVATT